MMITQKYKPTGNKELFDEHDTYQKLSAMNNPLERISRVMDSVGITGAKSIVGLIDLTYNLFLHERIIRLVRFEKDVTGVPQS